MSEQTLTSNAEEILQASVDALFRPDGDLRDPAVLRDCLSAVENLAGLFLSRQTRYDFEDLRFDVISLRLALARFHRDAFGVHQFESWLLRLEQENSVPPEILGRIRDRVLDLGIRINTARPLRTRVAAAFTLWMITLRPVVLHGPAAQADHNAGKFCGALSYWIATQYLRKFGPVILGTPQDADRRLERIHHDFTYRDVNLSSLELLYCSVFRPRSDHDAMIEPARATTA